MRGPIDFKALSEKLIVSEEAMKARAEAAEERVRAMGCLVTASTAQVEDTVKLASKHLAERDALTAKLEAAEEKLQQIYMSNEIAGSRCLEIEAERNALAADLDEVRGFLREASLKLADAKTQEREQWQREAEIVGARIYAALSLPPSERGKEIVEKLDRYRRALETIANLEEQDELTDAKFTEMVLGITDAALAGAGKPEAWNGDNATDFKMPDCPDY